MKKMLLMAMIAVLSVSCSNLPNEREVKASDVEVSGFVKNYLEVVDETYKFTKDGREGHITVKFKLVNTPTEAYHETQFPRLRINAVGENGEIFDTGVYGFSAEDKEFDKIKDLLETGKPGDTKSVSFTWRYLGQDLDLASRIFNEAVTFELIDDGFKAGEEPVEETDILEEIENTEEGEEYDAIAEENRLNMESDVAEKAQESASSNADFDKLLDEYEEYFKAIVKLNKKVRSGDQSAYADYMDITQKLADISDKLMKAEGIMTSAQAMRMANIIQKYSKEVQP